MRLTKQQLILSLIFPIINIVFPLFVSLFFILIGEAVNVWCYTLWSLAGSILPIILTVTLNIDTSRYVVHRIIFIVSAVMLAVLGCYLFLCVIREVRILFFILFISVVFLIVSSIFLINIFKRTNERIVLFLSNPIMYYLLILINIVYHHRFFILYKF